MLHPAGKELPFRQDAVLFLYRRNCFRCGIHGCLPEEMNGVMGRTGMIFWKIWKRLLTGAALAGAVLSCVGCAGKYEAEAEFARIDQNKKLVVYTSHKKEVYEPIVREFEERTGIWVQLETGGTTELLERIRGESGGHTCDIMFGGGVESYEVYQEVFEPYQSSQSEMLNDHYVSEEGCWTVFTELPIVLIYNNKLVGENQAPEGWEDLFAEQWRGRIAFADPRKSGSSCTMLTTMIQVLGLGERETLERFSEALAGRMSESSGAVLDEVASGSLLVGITLEETAKKYIAKGADLSIVYPKEGTSAVPDGCAIVKGAPHRENAGLFLEFIVSPDVQRLAVEKLYRRTVRTDIPQEKSAQNEILMDFDLEWAVNHQEDILEQWSELMENPDQAGRTSHDGIYQKII